MVDNSATGSNLAIDLEKSTTGTDSEHVNGTNFSQQSNSSHLVVQSAGILTMNLNHPNNAGSPSDTDGTLAAADTGDCANESQSNNINNLANSSSTPNDSRISGVNSVAGNVASGSLLDVAAAGSVANNNSISSAPALNCGTASVINSTVNNSSIISQPPISSSIQSSNNIARDPAASVNSNQLASQLPVNNLPNNLPGNLANPTVPPSFLPIGSTPTAATTTINLNNAGLLNGNNSTIASNLPHLNAPVPASCPTAANLITQAPIPIASSAAMNNATSNSVANVDIQDDSEDESEILEESPCGRWLKRREEVR